MPTRIAYFRWMDWEHLFVCLLLLIGSWLAVSKRKLTVFGGIGGALIGAALYLGAGLTGIALLATFFILGIAATAWKASAKQSLFKGENGSERHLGQVLANGGTAGLLGIAAVLYPSYQATLVVMIAAAFASATADTLSSELGTLYGKRFFNILTLQKDQRGLDGVVSLEGLSIGLLGSAIIATVYCIGWGWGSAFWWIIAGGTAGNLADSILGAALERRGLLKNDAVNFLNTAFAAMVAWLLVK